METKDLINEAVQGLGSVFAPTIYSAIESYKQNPMLHPVAVKQEKAREDNFKEKAALLDLLSKNKGLNHVYIAHDGNENTLWPTLVKNSNPTFEQQLEMIGHFKNTLPWALDKKYPNASPEDALEFEKEKVPFAKPKFY